MSAWLINKKICNHGVKSIIAVGSLNLFNGAKSKICNRTVKFCEFVAVLTKCCKSLKTHSCSLIGTKGSQVSCYLYSDSWLHVKTCQVEARCQNACFQRAVVNTVEPVLSGHPRGFRK